MKFKTSSRAVTLIEVLIAVAVLGLLSGVVALNVRNAINTQRFYDDVQKVVDRFRLAQDLMIITESDCQVVFERRDEVVYCTLRVVGKVTDGLHSLIGKEIALSSIQGFWFDEVESTGMSTQRSEGVVAIDFFALGKETTRGRIELSSLREREGGNRRWIALPGYPTYLESQAALPDLQPIDTANQNRSIELYPIAG